MRAHLTAADERTDEALRRLNRHLHNSFTAPLERDDALVLATAFDRIAQTAADIGAALDAAGDARAPHEARRATSLLMSALERLVTALGDLAAGRATGDAPGEARERLSEARDFVCRGRGDMLSAQLPVERLLPLKDLYDRLDVSLAAARDVERLEDAIELRGPVDSDLLLIIVVATALVFDFTNGFHDTPTSSPRASRRAPCHRGSPSVVPQS